MSSLLSVAISVGLLAGIWLEVAGVLGLLSWAGYVAWALFYASGGGVKGLLKTLPSNASGVIWGFVIAYISSGLTFPFAGGLVTAFICFFIVMQSKISFLSFIPGTLAGTATFFGTGGNLTGTLIAMFLGGLLAYISEVGGNLLAKITSPTLIERLDASN